MIIFKYLTDNLKIHNLHFVGMWNLKHFYVGIYSGEIEGYLQYFDVHKRSKNTVITIFFRMANIAYA
ncbi:hypothetical protein DFQ12_0165 [Sphingobacterium detergens]|uniref:Uncharacterized protein n=1 Tax=Sphingobacterium detergens TaxID=1145106 RepID=A0A420BF47_SPHD1|nr:hypothetical protein DFQ12_0165 [Sphingobacterium detergens]